MSCTVDSGGSGSRKEGDELRRHVMHPGIVFAQGWQRVVNQPRECLGKVSGKNAPPQVRSPQAAATGLSPGWRSPPARFAVPTSLWWRWLSNW